MNIAPLMRRYDMTEGKTQRILSNATYMDVLVALREMYGPNVNLARKSGRTWVARVGASVVGRGNDLAEVVTDSADRLEQATVESQVAPKPLAGDTETVVPATLVRR